MKLLNHTISRFVLVMLPILLVWAAVFYFLMLDEIYDSIDDGLENQKTLILGKIERDSTTLLNSHFDEGNYLVRKIPLNQAITYTDVYKDTLIYMQVEDDLEPVRLLTTAFEHKGEYYEMQIITPMVEEDDLIEDLIYSLLFLFLGLAASMLIISNFLLKNTWKPFYHLLDKLQKFQLEDPKPLMPTSSKIEEFRLLDASVRKLLENNIQTFNSQREFIENASHELQTPLAISLNKLELLAEYPQGKEQLQLIGSVMDNLKRLIRLNRTLLFLSKISNQQYAAETTVNFNTLIQECLSDFADQANFKNITVTLEEEGVCQREMNPDLAQILLVNLIKNAIVHNFSGGYVRIIINSDAIVIENSGKGQPLEQTKIFDRFYKSDASGSSIGLGLAIVKTIAELYQISLQYDYREKHIFGLRF